MEVVLDLVEKLLDKVVQVLVGIVLAAEDLDSVILAALETFD